VGSGAGRSGSRPGYRSGSRPGYETGRFTSRRFRTALSSWRASIRGTDILVAGIVAALSLGLAAYVYARAQAAARLSFADQAQRLQAAVAERLSVPLEDSAALSGLLEASGRVTRRQFRQLTSPMLRPDPIVRRRGLISALEWLPLVPDRERAALEAEARSAGLSSYRFWEMGPEGAPVTADRRPFYVPIQYMEPPNAGALGFDVASDPIRWHVAERARDSGMASATLPFRLVQEKDRPDASPAIAVYAPVYREGDPGSEEARRAGLTGFTIVIFRAAPLVDNAAAVANAEGLGLVLRDGEERDSPLLAERPRGASSLPIREDFSIGFPVRFADRRWSLRVFALPASFLPSRRGAGSVALFGTLAALLGLVLLTSLRTISRLRHQAEKVGPYRLIARLGQGAMGVVWEARHALLRRPTAVKLLAPGTEGERALARFEREVQLTAGLTHPSTIAIYDYGRTADGVFYYAMELLNGINLFQLIGFDGPLAPGRVVHLLRQACGALAEAHKAGLIHRDIKPANLMICLYGGIPDFLKILDFGLVKDVGVVEAVPDEGESAEQPDAALSQDGSLLGTPLYMAPEGMSDPTKIDARADLFALGAVGYYLLAGSSPFPGRTAIEVFTRERHGPPAPLSEAARCPIPPALEEVIRRCLSFRREERPQSAEELDALLQECEAGAPWNLVEAREWWRVRGQTALTAARREREEAGRVLFLTSLDRSRNN
jgi:serine/threonine protein kinase/CHASE1-domain containing sensor protein